MNHIAPAQPINPLAILFIALAALSALSNTATPHSAKYFLNGSNFQPLSIVQIIGF